MEKMMRVLLILLVICSAAKRSEAEVQTLQDFCVADLSSEVQMNGYACKKTGSVTADDFVSKELRNPNNVTDYLGSSANLVTAAKFPGLNTQGLSFARVDFGPGGLNPPHVHPRAAEVFHVISGRLYSAFVSTNYTLYATTLLPGDLMVFPMGLLHFQMNLDENSPAVALAAFSSQNPGRWDAARNLLNSYPNILDEVITKNFIGLTDIDVYMLRKFVSKAYADKVKSGPKDELREAY